MKWLAAVFLLFSSASFAQCKTFLINPQGDTINCTDVSGKKQGKWLIRVAPLRGSEGYDEEGEYRNDVKEGTWRRYNRMGDLEAVENYRWGMKDGISRYFNMNAELVREESWKAVNPADPYDTVDVEDPYNPGLFNKVRVKLDGKAMKHGTWKFFDDYTGNFVKAEKWYMNKLEDPNKPKTVVASADGTVPASDSTKPAATKVKPKEILDFEKKNAGKKKVKVRDGRTGG